MDQRPSHPRDISDQVRLVSVSVQCSLRSLSAWSVASETSSPDGQVSNPIYPAQFPLNLMHGPLIPDDVFKSTVHRAVNRSGVRRYSIPLFFGTDYDVKLEVRAEHSGMIEEN